MLFIDMGKEIWIIVRRQYGIERLVSHGIGWRLVDKCSGETLLPGDKPIVRQGMH